jgi:hypothetical protein
LIAPSLNPCAVSNALCSGSPGVFLASTEPQAAQALLGQDHGQAED